MGDPVVGANNGGVPVTNWYSGAPEQTQGNAAADQPSFSPTSSFSEGGQDPVSLNPEGTAPAQPEPDSIPDNWEDYFRERGPTKPVDLDLMKQMIAENAGADIRSFAEEFLAEYGDFETRHTPSITGVLAASEIERLEGVALDKFDEWLRDHPLATRAQKIEALQTIVGDMVIQCRIERNVMSSGMDAAARFQQEAEKIMRQMA